MIRRHFLGVLTVLSLVLCVATVALWVRSYTTRDRIDHGWVRKERHSVDIVAVESDRGLITVYPIRDTYKTSAEFSQMLARLGARRTAWQSHAALPWDLGWRPWNEVGFGYDSFNSAYPWGNQIERLISFPDWLLVLVFAALPVRWAVKRVIASRQYGPGRCTSCGYDLTGNTSGVCPECGTLPAREAGT